MTKTTFPIGARVPLGSATKGTPLATSSFSKRTIAIAVAAGMAISGVQAVSPAGAADAPAVSADAAAAGQRISNGDVKFVGLFNADGSQIEGPIRSAATANDAQGTVVPSSDAYVKVKVTNLGNASAGDKIILTPIASFTHPETGKEESNKVTGVFFSTAQSGVPLEVNGQRIATLDTVGGGDATITFDKAVEDLDKGELTVSLPVSFGGRWSGDYGRKEDPKSQDFSGTWSLQVRTPGDPQPTSIDSRPMTSHFYRETAYIDKVGFYADSNSVVAIKPSDDADPRTEIRRFEWRAPTGQDAEIIFEPSLVTGNVPWKFSDGAPDPKLAVWEFDLNDSEKRTSGDADPGDMKMSAEFRDGKWIVRVTGVRNNQKPVIAFTSAQTPLGTGEYAFPGTIGAGITYTPLNEQGGPAGPPVDRSAPLRTLTKLNGVEGTGTNYQWSAQAEASIAGLPEGSGDGVAVPARIAGQTTKFVFVITNTGTGPIRTVEVTTPDGKQVEKELDKAIRQGESAAVEIDYAVPADAAKLDFKVTARYGTLNLGTHSFLVDQKTRFVDNGNGTFTLISPTGEEMVVLSASERDRLQGEIDALKDRPDRHIVNAVRNPDNSITITRSDGTNETFSWVIEPASKKGLERCMSGTGGVILALLPVLGLLGAGLSQVKLPGIGEQMEQIQRQAGIYNEDLARFVADNGPAIGTTIGALAAALLLFVPGTCGDMSLAGAIGEAGNGSSAKPAADATPAQ